MARLWRTATMRLALVLALIFGLGSGAILLTLEASAARFAEQTLEDALRDQMAVMRADVEKEGLGALAEIMAHERSGEAGSHLYYLLVGPGGAVFDGGLPVSVTQRPGYGRALVTAPAWSVAPGRTVPVMTLTVHLPGGEKLAVARDLGPMTAFKARIVWLGFWGSIGLMVLALVGGLGAGYLFIRRLDTMNAAAAAIVGNDRDERLPAIGFGREFDELSANLNGMLDRLGDAMTALRQVSSDVAHDLRTPLTRLRATLEEATTATAADQDDLIREALDETDAILATFSTLLRISQIEGGDVRKGFAPVDLAEVARQAADLYQPSMEDAGLVLEVEASDGVSVLGDRAMILQALANLLENATLHAGGAGRVRISVSSTSNDAILRVADDGVGVRPESLSQLGRRFFREDPSRQGPGAGLGLSMVSAIARTHQAELLFDAAGSGLVVTLAFPIDASR